MAAICVRAEIINTVLKLTLVKVSALGSTLEGPWNGGMDVVADIGDGDRVILGEKTTGDPNWTRDELIVACDLLATCGWHELPTEDYRVIELSNFLQTLPIHSFSVRSSRFRSPSSVRRKMADIATQHPESHRRKANGSQLDRMVLADFLEWPDEMHATAELIRKCAASGEFNAATNNLDDVIDDVYVAREGQLLELRHFARERNSGLRRRKIKAVLAKNGCLECEICKFDFERYYGVRGAGFAECHHVVPLHASGETTTSLTDLAVLCSNCHRIIHRRRPWLTPMELRELVHERLAMAR